MKLHTFTSTGEAYDASQCEDGIHDKDVLYVPETGQSAVLFEAWPVAITGQPGEFHCWQRGPMDFAATYREYTASVRIAQEAAGHRLAWACVPGLGFQCRCSCGGFCSRMQDTQLDAQAEFDQHLRFAVGV